MFNTIPGIYANFYTIVIYQMRGKKDITREKEVFYLGTNEVRVVDRSGSRERTKRDTIRNMEANVGM